MDSANWQAYFERNACRASPDTPSRLAPLAPNLHAPLIHAIQCFQLGEAGEGRVAHEAAQSSDPALDDAMKIAVALYVREEGRHARELKRLLRAFGAPTIKHHPFEDFFKHSRRSMGLRAKMVVIAVAEIVGSSFYKTLAQHVPCPHVAAVAHAIGADEERHLAFQRDYFSRVMATTQPLLRPILAFALSAWFVGVLAGAIFSVAFGHRKLFVALGLGPWRFAALCLERFWRLIWQEHARYSGLPSTSAG